jgi:hypothetical protein
MKPSFNHQTINNTQALPADLTSTLPTVEEFEKELNKGIV